jgi:ribosomal protein S12 methylthiotransferase
MRLNIYIRTLGCDKNTVDSECVAGLLEESGHTITGDPDAADVILVNTCGFIRDAKQESVDAILDFAVGKRSEQRLIVTGCLSQRYGDELSDLIPEAEYFLGVNDYRMLPTLIEASPQGQRVFAGPYEPNGSKEFHGWDDSIGPRSSGAGALIHTAPIKIAEGCSNACSYCSIPAIRGPYRSRPAESILQEAGRLAGRGCKELVLVAQDVAAYGQDLRGTGHLVRLLQALVKIEGIEWVRLMYCYEEGITDELIDTIRTEPKICKYIDIPLQHSCDSILQRMNRLSTRASIKSTINKLRKQIPDIAIRTTLIVGFPGETEEEFDDVKSFVESMKFERLGVFAYSQEEGTPAALMAPQIPEAEKERRRDEIMQLQCAISLEHNRRRIGQTIRVLVDEVNEDGTYTGRTMQDAPDIDNGVLFASEDDFSPGEFACVTVEDAFDYDLAGTGRKEVRP